MIIAPKEQKNKFKIFLLTVLGILCLLVIYVSYLLYTIKANYSDEPMARIIHSVTEKITEPEKTDLSIIILGDMMFDRAVRRKINNEGYDAVFGDTSTIIEPYDIRIANLEGPVTTYPSKTLLPNGTTAKVLSFTFPTSTASELKRVGFDAVSLANNHTDNFGYKGLVQTRENLKLAGIKYFGDPANVEEISTVLCDKVKIDLCVAVIGFHEFAYKNQQNIIHEIQKYKNEGYFTIVFPHWGEEYKQVGNANQRRNAYAWIDAGADLIVGAHPHVVAESEVYKEKFIFYSLGNFIFDQYFSFNTTHGLGLGIHLNFTEDSVTGKKVAGAPTFDLIPIANTGIEVKKLSRDNPEFNQVLSVFASSSEVWQNLKSF